MAHTSEGRSHRYRPLVGREEYARRVTSTVLSNYFGGSLVQLVSFFSRHERIAPEELEEMLRLVRRADGDEPDHSRGL